VYEERFRARDARTGVGIGRSRIGGGFLGRRGARLGLRLLCLLLYSLTSASNPILRSLTKVEEERGGGMGRGGRDIGG
jgi:hypothetical protein